MRQSQRGSKPAANTSSTSSSVSPFLVSEYTMDSPAPQQQVVLDHSLPAPTTTALYAGHQAAVDQHISEFPVRVKQDLNRNMTAGHASDCNLSTAVTTAEYAVASVLPKKKPS